MIEWRGTTRMMHFEILEYKERLGRTKEDIYGQGIEVLLATDPANMNCLIGYDGWSFCVHQGVLVVKKHATTSNSCWNRS